MHIFNELGNEKGYTPLRKSLHLKAQERRQNAHLHLKESSCLSASFAHQPATTVVLLAFLPLGAGLPLLSLPWQEELYLFLIECGEIPLVFVSIQSRVCTDKTHLKGQNKFWKYREIFFPKSCTPSSTLCSQIYGTWLIPFRKHQLSFSFLVLSPITQSLPRSHICWDEKSKYCGIMF